MVKDKDPANAEQFGPAGVPYCNDRWPEGGDWPEMHLCDRPDGHDVDGDQHECRCGVRW